MDLERQIFVESCMEHLDHAEQAVLEVEDGGPFQELLQLVYRSLHTIKGDAKTFGSVLAATMAHTLEDELEMILHQGPPLRKEHATMLLTNLDALRAAIHTA
ncbi:Hpt domain-containing protein [Megalodesulfovibrio paquesii]